MSRKMQGGLAVPVLVTVLGLGVGCGGVEDLVEVEHTGRAEQANRGFIPDLTAEDIYRDSNYYKVKYCNRGSYGSDGTFAIWLRNDLTGQIYQGNPNYPFNVPAPGTCQWTGGITCSLVGTQCDAAVSLTAVVDAQREVLESYEYNNAVSVSFEENLVRPDLVVEEVVRSDTAYHARFCNRGNSGSAVAFGITWRNLATNQGHTPPTMLAVPAPGKCGWTEGVACGSVGSTCTDTVDLRVTADVSNSVLELNEGNNDLVVGFTPAFSLPDLVVSDIWKEGNYFYVSYCNQGSGTSPTRFTVNLTSLTTGLSFQSGEDMPFAVPAPGTCATTGGFTCGMIGCESTQLRAQVDNTNEVFESSEYNNALSRSL